MAAQLGGGTEEELLIEFHRAASQVTTDEAGVLGLGPSRVANCPGQDRSGEARREPFKLCLDPRCHLLVRTHVAGRHVGIAVQRVMARGRSRVVIEGVLSDNQRGALGHLAPAPGLSRPRKLLQVAGYMHEVASRASGAVHGTGARNAKSSLNAAVP